MSGDRSQSPNRDAASDDLAEQLREALRFLSHDAREGHSSTLALVELQRVRADSMGAGELALRVESNARKALLRIDDFVAHARAQTHIAVDEELDLLDLIADAAAECWQAGNERGVRVKVSEMPPEALIQADRGLLQPAIERLIHLALEQCRRGSDLVCTVQDETQGQPKIWSMTLDEIRSSRGDEGDTGAAAQETERRHAWAFVELVIRKMGGELTRFAVGEKGVRFRVTLPRR